MNRRNFLKSAGYAIGAVITSLAFGAASNEDKQPVEAKANKKIRFEKEGAPGVAVADSDFIIGKSPPLHLNCRCSKFSLFEASEWCKPGSLIMIDSDGKARPAKENENFIGIAIEFTKDKLVTVQS